MTPERVIADAGFHSLSWLMDLVAAGKLRQLSKWGLQRHPPEEWMLYLTEEVGELAKAIAEDKYDRGGSPAAVVSEAIQVATLALTIVEGYSHKHIDGRLEETT